MPVEWFEIETFLTLAEELHFGRTAERLGRTKARVSQTIQVLERRVGVPLFERTSRRVTLTPTGRRLTEDLRPAYEQVNAAMARAVADGRGLAGTLTVGFVGAATGQLVVRAAEEFRRRHADCEVRLREVQVGGAVERLRADEVDLLFGCFPIEGPDLTSGPAVLTEARMLAVPARHRFAGRASIAIADLVRERLVVAPCSIPAGPRPSAEEGLAGPRPSAEEGPAGPRPSAEEGPAGPRPSAEEGPAGPAAETFQEVLALVGAGQGVFVVGAHVTRFYARPDVAYVLIHDAPPLRWGPVWRTVRATARVRAFVDAAAGLPA
ncbi:LysR family transcriptional regulator [Actinoplanes ianthinogenes]|uniref:LysR family transcriptional regulator n=1 Tax=Actinoplanes ianthinogenes TaxID=122358 RepID=A0ABM7M9V5_9ACTN|nr:LysR family transcriptional regulator [Actinoplanes ianthinogenes]BCJ48448.1 LysR family transcriptional regulator [Actinoplanes ianthinogenes]GGR46298.1 LysR family transcriptional regulator [Actinoplanes ianthinogenes]